MITTSPLGRTVRGSGPGLLLAHGATGSIDGNYGPLLDGLAAHHRVVGPDYPGSGRTPRATGPLDLDGLADALVATAVDEGLDTFAIAGYSLGTPLAVRAATRHPSRVTALVLTAAFAHPSARMRLLLDDWLRLLRADDGHEAVARWAALLGAGAPYLDRMPSDELAATIAAARDSIPPGAVDQVLLGTRADVRADLPHVAVPTLVISTTHDAMVTPHHHHEVAAGIPDAKLAELPTGHLPFVEAPSQWLTLIRDFLAATA